jgi:hypothetical protein
MTFSEQAKRTVRIGPTVPKEPRKFPAAEPLPNAPNARAQGSTRRPRRIARDDGEPDDGSDAEPPLSKHIERAWESVPPLHLRPWGGVAETCQYFGISRSLLYDLMKGGDVKYAKLRERRFVDIPSLLQQFKQKADNEEAA